MGEIRYRHARQRKPGIGKSEDGQDRERDWPVKIVFEIPQWRTPLLVAHRYAERDQHAGQCRVNARLEDGNPEHDAEYDVARCARNAEAIHRDGCNERQPGEEQ